MPPWLRDLTSDAVSKVGKGFAFLLSFAAVVGMVFGFSAWVETAAVQATDELAAVIAKEWEMHEVTHEAAEQKLQMIGAQLQFVAASQQVMLDMMAREQRSRDRRRDDE